MNIEGRIIGNRYEIIERVGSGGMATVYKARDTILNRYVAVKVLRDEFTTDEEFIKRFNTEAQSAARLTHPNIVSVFDVGQEYNIYYIVMELIQGKTLKQIISEEGALPWKWTVNIAIQICSALEMAHRNGIIHRDIKPHNIIITEDGIAKAVSNSTITAFGTTIGSVHYFSPEHARGGYTDAKSDIYSLGVVMYEMITGRVPFDADTPVSVALKHMQEEPIEPIQLNSNIPASINRIILKAMKKDASARYASATEMSKDLSKALKNPTASVVEEGATGQFTKVIPTITENMINEDKDRSESRTATSRRGATTTRQKETESSKSKNPIAKYLEENPKMKPVVITGLAIAAILLCVLIFWGSWKITTKILGINPGAHQQSGISLPGVTSISVDEAKKKLDDMGIKYEIEEVYDNEVEEGKVISQKPDAGTNYDVQKNSPVKLTVSKGAKKVIMPKVKGLNVEDAKDELKKVELEVKEEKEDSVTVEEGVVIRQEIEEGKEVNAGSTVTIYVSKGPKKVTVISVEDMTVEEAKKALTDAGLEVNIKYKEEKTKTVGIVLKQSIDVGEVVNEGTQITLTVNKIEEMKQATINVHVKSITGYKEPTASDKKPNVKNVSVKITVDGEKVYEENVAENTELITKTIKAKGIVNVRVYVDDTRYANEDIDMNGSNTVLDVKK